MLTRSVGAVTLTGSDPATHESHPVHGPDRVYRETNCYADVLVELLHARGEQPLAAMGCLVRTDWEGDQFTYAKPRPAELERLFGVDVHEMLPYRPIPDHIAEQLGLGRTVLVEIDAYWLPDTEGTSYRRGHLKTTVAPEMIDREVERLRYFHNGGLYELSGEDYRGAFHLLPRFTEDVMDPFIEIVRFDAGRPLRGAELRHAARALLVHHLERRPAVNPFVAWGDCLPDHVERLRRGSVEACHEYAFVTARMIGSAFELLADHLEWLLGDDDGGAAEALRPIASHSTTLSLRLARRRPFDVVAALAPMRAAWDDGMERLTWARQRWS